MKICVLSPSFPRFSDDWRGSWVLLLSKELLKKSINSEIVCADDILVNDEYPNEKIKVKRFQYWITRKHQLLGYGIMENLNRYFLAKIQIPFFLLSFFIKTLKVAKNNDIIHAHWIYSGIIAIICKYIYKKPVVLTLHNAYLKDYPEWVKKIVLKNVDAIISPHPELTKLVNNYGSFNIFDIKNLIDYERFTYKRRFKQINSNIHENDLDGFIKKKKVISFIARFDDWKDPITFIEAIPKVIADRKDVCFLIVGTGTLEIKMIEKINELDIAAYVKLLGPRTDVDYILSVTDIYVGLSTLQNIWSVIIVEAVSMKVPCILTKAGETDKYFSQYKDAVLIPIKSPTALSYEMIKLLNDQALRTTIANNAYKLLENHGFLSADKVVEDTINVYNIVLNGGKSV